MGPQLRAFVEEQLLKDLLYYGVTLQDLKFDWSNSCIEGHDAAFLDGSFENFSEISLFDINDNPIAEGWMDFLEVELDPPLIIYWNFLDVIENGHLVSKKKSPGIPEHVWQRLSPKEKESNENDRMKNGFL